QPALFLLLGPVGQEIVRDDRRMHAGAGTEAAAKARARNLRCDNQIVAARAATAAISLRDAGAEKARLARLSPRLAADDAGALPFFGMGNKLALEEAACAVAQEAQFFGHPLGVVHSRVSHSNYFFLSGK